MVVSLSPFPSSPPVGGVPSVPLRFWNGDRLVQKPDDRAVWTCALYGWRPEPDDGSGIWTDDQVRDNLAWSQAPGETGGVRFVPRYLSIAAPLHGTRLPDRAAVESADLLSARSAVPYLAVSGERPEFVSLRDRLAGYGEELPAAMSMGDVREALAVVLEEQEPAWLDGQPQPRVTFHRPSGRLYARYQARGEDDRVEIRTYVYVLNGPH